MGLESADTKGWWVMAVGGEAELLWALLEVPEASLSTGELWQMGFGLKIQAGEQVAWTRHLDGFWGEQQAEVCLGLLRY